jgi:hypothetical protein
MQTSESTLNPFRKTAHFLGGLTTILALVIGGACSKRSLISPLGFGHLAVPTATNANFVFITVTNQSDEVVVYVACPAQVWSNGIWSGMSFPSGHRMTTLTARQSGVVVVEAAAVKEKSRVPILWGFLDFTPRATKWQQFKEKLYVRMKGRAGVGLLYTNYLSNFKP